jgi:predicted nuclease with RNAse H fold
MRTLGIDLAAQPEKTAVCEIAWLSGRALPQAPKRGAEDDELLDRMADADWVGIDAPFGWPDRMVDAIHDFARENTWPADAAPERLRYRNTDWFVHEFVAENTDPPRSVWPLSVSSDRIAVCAWRCASLLTRHVKGTGRKLDRIGVPPGTATKGAPGQPGSTGLVAPQGVVEVYPAGALVLWAFPHKGYKTTASTPASEARLKREEIVALIEHVTGGWMTLTDDVRQACVQTDDQLDAFVSALVACAAATGVTVTPRSGRLAAARREGWIHLPYPDSLSGLAAVL